MSTIKDAITNIAVDAGYDGDKPQTIADAIEAYGTVAGGGGGGAGATLDIVYKLNSAQDATTQASHTVEEIDAFVEANGVKGLTLTINNASTMSPPMCESLPCKMKNSYGSLVFEGFGTVMIGSSISLVSAILSTNSNVVSVQIFTVSASGTTAVSKQFTISA